MNPQRLNEIKEAVIIYLNAGPSPATTLEGAPTFFNLYDLMMETENEELPKVAIGVSYDELKEALAVMVAENTIYNEVPEGDLSKTTSVWLRQDR